MNSIIEYIKEVLGGVKSLITGMKVTGYYFVHPKEIVTEKYPENRATLKMQDNFKGEVVMPHDENNQHKCTACGICQNYCPNGTINVISQMVEEDGKKKKALDKYIYNLGMCTFCGLCVKYCPFDAIEFGQDFEHAVFSRQDLVKTLNKEGSKLKVVPKVTVNKEKDA